MGISRVTLCDRRREEVSYFNSLPIFPDRISTWEAFVSLGDADKNKPFALSLLRCYGEGFKSLEHYYFFGVINETRGNSLRGQFFTPKMFTSYTPAFFDEITKGTLGLDVASRYECKVLSLSFDEESFDKVITEHSFYCVDEILKNVENQKYVLHVLSLLKPLCEALSSYTFKNFKAEIKRIEELLGKARNIENKKKAENA